MNEFLLNSKFAKYAGKTILIQRYCNMFLDINPNERFKEEG